MRPVLIAYASTEGHGAEIARHLQKNVESQGKQALLVDVKSELAQISQVMFGPEQEQETSGESSEENTNAQSTEQEPLFFGAIVVGSIHFGDYDTELFGFAKRFGRLLSTQPSAFLSVSLSAASDDMSSRMSVDATAHTLLLETDWLPSKLLHVAGAVKEKELNFFKRGALQAVLRAKGIKPDPSGTTVFTDWAELDNFLQDFLALASEKNYQTQ